MFVLPAKQVGYMRCLAIALFFMACVAIRTKTSILGTASAGDKISLPAPAQRGQMSVEEALARRRSVREFSGKPLTYQQLGQLCWAAQGVTQRDGRRTAPSAGALYPLELYVVTVTGFFHYEPAKHVLQVLDRRDLQRELYRAALSQDSVREAAAVFVITGNYARTAGKYGSARSPRYVHLEAGHAAENLLLEAVVLHLGAVPVGAFDDAQVQKVLSLPMDEEPLYLIPVGYPR